MDWNLGITGWGLHGKMLGCLAEVPAQWARRHRLEFGGDLPPSESPDSLPLTSRAQHSKTHKTITCVPSSPPLLPAPPLSQCLAPTPPARICRHTQCTLRMQLVVWVCRVVGLGSIPLDITDRPKPTAALRGPGKASSSTHNKI